jgi:hypothetical protein
MEERGRPGTSKVAALTGIAEVEWAGRVGLSCWDGSAGRIRRIRLFSVREMGAQAVEAEGGIVSV